MIEGDPIRKVQMFIDERWAVAQPKFYPDTANGPRLQPEVTPSEAAYFMASLVAHGTEPPLFSVNDERKLRSDRHPPLPDGMPRSFHFFEEPGRLRLETIVHMAAMARLHFDFGWPREHLVFESPAVTKHETEVLTGGALDILLLEAPCAELVAKMPISAARPRVGVEAKADSKRLGKLLDAMRACQASAAPHGVASDHKKCRAIAELRPRLFLGVAAGAWRLFTVVECDGLAVLGDEIPGLGGLSFS